MTLIKSISGIRGTIGGAPGEALTPLDIVKFTSAFGSWIKETTGIPKIVIGRDARPSGEMISHLVSGTLRGLGMDVVDLGLSTTPTVEIAVPLEEAGGGIILTASHNPLGWNALKLVNQDGEFISGQEGIEVLELAESEKFEFSEYRKLGKYQINSNYLDKHIEMITMLPMVEEDAIKQANFKIVVDGVNSTGGLAVPKLLKALGIDQVVVINGEPNGIFPHNPEPLPENITQLCAELDKGNYDLGIVVDPDVDRLALVCEDGIPFGEEYTVVAAADYVLDHLTGNTVSNLSSSQALKDITEKKGGTYYSAAVGEVNVVAKMKEINAVIGGEGNGGVIYPNLHYGRDALVGIALILSHLAKTGKKLSHLKAEYPHYFISKNKIDLTPDLDLGKVLDGIRKKYQNQPINSEDGVRIEFDSEWVHLRKSNTEPIIRIISESDSQVKAEQLANKLIEDIKEVIQAPIDE